MMKKPIPANEMSTYLGTVREKMRDDVSGWGDINEVHMLDVHATYNGVSHQVMELSFDQCIARISTGRKSFWVRWEMLTDIDPF